MRRSVDIGARRLRPAPNRYAVILLDERTGERVVLWQRDPPLAPHPARPAGDLLRRCAAGARGRRGRGGGARRGADWRAAEGLRVTSDIDQVTTRTRGAASTR